MNGAATLVTLSSRVAGFSRAMSCVLYYGGADSCVAIAIASLSDVLDFLKDSPIQ